MAKSKSLTPKMTAVQKSLNAAARLLNRPIHSPLIKAESKERNNALRSMNDSVFLVTLHQPWCLDEDKALASATSNEAVANAIAADHHEKKGHLTDVIHSNR